MDHEGRLFDDRQAAGHGRLGSHDHRTKPRTAGASWPTRWPPTQPAPHDDVIDGVPDECIAVPTKNMGSDQCHEFEKHVRTVYPQMVRISAAPCGARYYDLTAGRVPELLRRLATA